MPKNEDGEFELVLGNKQLLSMFFVVVVLLGVFFVMGYIVGRNSAPILTADNGRKAETKPLVVDSPAPKAETQPAPAASQPAPAESAPPPKPEPAKPEPQPAPQREAKAPETPKAADTKAHAEQSDQVVTGATYLQVSATNNKGDADKMVDTLRKNGFQALEVPIPEKAGWVRVYVGPIAGGDINKTRDDLQSKSFNGKGAFLKKF